MSEKQKKWFMEILERNYRLSPELKQEFIDMVEKSEFCKWHCIDMVGLLNGLTFVFHVFNPERYNWEGDKSLWPNYKDRLQHFINDGGSYREGWEAEVANFILEKCPDTVGPTYPFN